MAVVVRVAMLVRVHTRAVAVSRMGAAQIATPDLVTQDGDLVYLAVTIGHVSEVDEHLGGAASGRGIHT